ncbi:MAG: hypothetical protein WC337_09435 [Candidatus Muiribacteriota bacterium]
MKDFKELALKGINENLKNFYDNIKNEIENIENLSDWSIDFNKEFENFIIFNYRGSQIVKSSVFLNLDYSNSEFKVTNIIPAPGEKIQLSKDEYNKILDKFEDDCITETARKYSLLIEKDNNDEAQLSDYLTEEGIRKFKSFSNRANKSTGSAHPLDRKRWYDFICQTFLDGNDNIKDILAEWLIEEENWTEEKAYKLLLEYEFGYDLLNHFQDNNTNDN